MSKYIGTPVVNLSVDTVDVTGDITATDSTPELILLNDTHEDIEGGREGKITFKGEQSGGEVTVLAQIQSGHDGTSDDEKGDLIFKTNDGSDGNSPTERLRISSDSTFTFTSDDAGAGIGPHQIYYRNSSSPADNDLLTEIDHRGRNDNSQDVDYATVNIFAEDVSDGTEDGKYLLQTIKAGAVVSRMDVNSTETVFNDDSKDVDFRVESDDNANMLFVDAGNNRVGIGLAAPVRNFHLHESTTSQPVVFAMSTNGTGATTGDGFNISIDGSSGAVNLIQRENESMQFYTNGGSNERMRIDSDGRVMIGTTTEGHANADNFTVSGSGKVGITLRSTDSDDNNIYFSDGTSGTPEYAGYIAYNHANNFMNFGTNATEHIRILSGGRVHIGDATSSDAFADLSSSGNILVAGMGAGFGDNAHVYNIGGFTGTYDLVVFRNGNGVGGSINLNGSTTTYNTSSDYRLKENVTDVTDGITRVKQLAPKRFNFIANADTTVDGFLAHEAATVVPEAVTGTKDELEVWKEHEELPDGVSVGDNKLDDNGNTIPKMQGIDQSKLVPLLTAALQEAIAKIETLETKVAALEGE